MTRQFHIFLFGSRNDFFQEVGDALPIFLVRYPALVPHGDALPIAFQLERVVDDPSPPSDLPVPAIGDHLTVISNDSYANLRCFPNITDNDVNLTLLFGSLTPIGCPLSAVAPKGP